MLPEIGASELLVIAVVALIVVGPKDLPVLLRKLGQFMAKMRGMAADFRASFDEMARQSELDELRKEVAAMRRGDFGEVSVSAIEAPVNEAMQDIERSLADVGVDLTPSYQYAELARTQIEPDLAPEPAEPVKTPRKPRAAAKPKAAAPATKAAKASKTPKAPKASKTVDGAA